MFRKIEVARLSAGTVYKLFAIGTFCSIIPLCTVMGFFALFGLHTLAWNGQPVTGLSGLLAGPFIGAFIAAFFVALWGTACVVGLWIYSCFFSFNVTVQEIEVAAPRNSTIFNQASSLRSDQR